MKVGVLSDTHCRALPGQMLSDFRVVDLIVHAGDFCSLEDYEVLARIKKVEAVCGNMDNAQLAQKFPKRKVFSCGRFQVGLFHGEGPPTKILERVKAEFSHDKVDVVIFGHSHQPFNQKIGNVLYFNPGSPTDTVFAPYRSYGILDFSADGVKGEIIKVKE